MIEFFSPNSRALFPTFRTNSPDGSQFAHMGSHFAHNTTPNPCSLLSPFGGYVPAQNTPKQYKLPRWVSICPYGVSFCPQYHPQPLFFTQSLWGICTYTKHPKAHPKTPLFLAWTWKWAKWTTVWAIWIPTGQNVWTVGKTFVEVGKTNLFIWLILTPQPQDDSGSGGGEGGLDNHQMRTAPGCPTLLNPHNFQPRIGYSTSVSIHPLKAPSISYLNDYEFQMCLSLGIEGWISAGQWALRKVT